MDLLDEVIDRVYKIKMKRGGVIKDPTYNIYKEGYGGSDSMFGFLSKYRLKMAFLEGNRELKSFEL